MEAQVKQGCFFDSLGEKNDFFAYAKNYLEKCLNSGVQGALSACSEQQMVGFDYSKKNYKQCVSEGLAKNPKEDTKLFKDSKWVQDSKVTHSPVLFVNDKVIRVS